MRDLLNRANISGLDIDRYLDQASSGNSSDVPRIGIAVSGGGYRAMLNGAGAIAAFDNRTANATGQGQLGGLLQSATYLSGLSGGSWLVGSLYVQNFSTVESIIAGGKLWQFDDSIFEGPSDVSTLKYYDELFQTVDDKHNAGFNTTITDYWGRALSYQLVDASNGGPAITFSSISKDSDFSQAQAPMPIILALERPMGQIQVPANATIFEFNPWEMGSFDPGAAAFAPLKFIGSNFTNGTVPSDGECLAGYDNAGFVMGTSSSLFNQAFLQISDVSDIPDFLVSAINDTLSNLSSDERDVALWPNPFYKYNPSEYVNSSDTELTLVDGGESLQNIPLHPLLLTARHVDVIFAVDGSADTKTNWPNGTSLVATYNQSQSGNPTNVSALPKVPDVNTFVNLGLNGRPTFFGCPGNSSGSDASPLIVYLPNHPYSFDSNTSTFDLEYSDFSRMDIIQNGYDVVTQGNGTADPAWTKCVGCAILARSFERTNTDIPSECADCFSRYCWNGTTNSTVPATYEPQLIAANATNDDTDSGAGRLTRTGIASAALAVMFCTLWLM
jgi:lysophospholipase